MQVHLFGYEIYGIKSPEHKTLGVVFGILDNNKGHILSEKSQEITFDGTTTRYRILFESPVVLEPFNEYKFYTLFTGSCQQFIGTDYNGTRVKIEQ